jgi:hypothetical protein
MTNSSLAGRNCTCIHYLIQARRLIGRKGIVYLSFSAFKHISSPTHFEIFTAPVAIHRDFL